MDKLPSVRGSVDLSHPWRVAMWGSAMNAVLHPTSVPAAVADGLAMGALHVMTGADHLSAVATLACGNSRTRAFWLGARWGSGHSVGQGRRDKQ